ncbi:hypothetical protein SEA_SKOG_150 [Gordonia phage Skog]|uniref:Uncharacterized protein n=1 Tax=Gordonia phage Skog TaxID=2704033 RepID=A0A6G6XJM6_9CAUD|nr:hypothetical protein KHQ85_gp150 [Gordonia phage Skog]QIG58302.1 hypothetical protein SEA_SKOG_150 [Gordonia phage Skog]
MATGLCWSCKGLKEITYTEDSTRRGFCEACIAITPPSSDEMAVLYLLSTIPFRVGDRVEARTAGEVLDGVGVIDDFSVSLEHGGTPVYPTFHVTFEDKAHELCPDGAWYTEMCLTLLQSYSEKEQTG